MSRVSHVNNNLKWENVNKTYDERQQDSFNLERITITRKHELSSKREVSPVWRSILETARRKG